ncbi:MAG: SPFH domain-containing protein [Myxococcota bacterium]|nr:SPFH domain-containing protein [Myxococcota bacterium]
MLSVVAILAAVAIVLAVKGIKIVQHSKIIIVERLGKYHSTLESGINIIWPFIDKPRAIVWRFTLEGHGGQTVYLKKAVTEIDLRETVYDFPSQSVITADNVQIMINAVLYFQITDPVKAVYEVQDLPDAIEKLTQTSLRNVVGDMDLDKTLTSRDTINGTLRTLLEDATNKWGVKVNRVELQDIQPPEEIRAAMEKQMRAERDRRAAILEAEGDKQSAVLRAEGDRDAAIADAEGAKTSEVLRAEGDAQARLLRAQAEAEAIERVRAAAGDEQAVRYLTALRYIDSLELIAKRDSGGDKLVFMPYESSGVLGSLGGIKELLNEVKS